MSTTGKTERVLVNGEPGTVMKKEETGRGTKITVILDGYGAEKSFYSPPARVEPSDLPPPPQEPPVCTAHDVDPDWLTDGTEPLGLLQQTPQQQPETEIPEPIRLKDGTDPLFDAYIFVDWSAANKPSEDEEKDSLWSSEAQWVERTLQIKPVMHHRTRHECYQYLLQRLVEHIKANRRVLIGLDFAYGYPSGFRTALDVQGTEPDWLAIWQFLAEGIADNKENANNRFAFASDANSRCGNSPGPFWGCPKAEITQHLLETKCCYPYGQYQLAEFRQVERRLKAPDRKKQPKSVWQLFCGVTVGSQSLTGIPRLMDLRFSDRLRDHSQVWPFETGWSCPRDVRPLVIHAEIWPRAITLDYTLHDIPDAAEMLSLVRKAATDDANGQLEQAFRQPVWLRTQHNWQTLEQQVLEAEGWILWADGDGETVASEGGNGTCTAISTCPVPRDQMLREERDAPERHQPKIDTKTASWVYFANPKGVTLERTAQIARQYGWLWRPVHNKDGAAIANVKELRPGHRIYLYYSEHGRLKLLVSGTIVDPETAGKEPVGNTKAGDEVPAFGFWHADDKELKGYPKDLILNRYTGICIVPDKDPISPGRVCRPKGNNAIWKFEKCLNQTPEIRMEDALE